MSLTTTDNPLTYATVRLLADYDLQHSDIPEGTTPAAPNPHPAPANVENPPDWETNWRRVPAYRPADPEIDFEFRNTYNNNIERAFLWHMFRGVRLVSNVDWLWRKTGGRINDQIFRYAIGGEW